MAKAVFFNRLHTETKITYEINEYGLVIVYENGIEWWNMNVEMFLAEFGAFEDYEKHVELF